MLRNDKECLERVGIERSNVLLMVRDELDDLLPGAVADAKADDFGWMAVKQTALLKIGVLRDDGEAVSTCILPNVLVREAEQPALANMRAVGKKRRQQAGKLVRKVLIKEQLHAERRSAGVLGLRQTQNTPECRHR